MSVGDELIVHLDAPLPATLEVGSGTVLYLSGRCYHSVRSLRSLTISIVGMRPRTMRSWLARL